MANKAPARKKSTRKASTRSRSGSAGKQAVASDRSRGSRDAAVAFPDSLDTANVSRLYGQLQGALVSGKPVVLDASAVRRVSTAAIQLFCAFFDEAEEREVAVTWKDPSPALLDAARLLGLSAALGLGQGGS